LNDAAQSAAGQWQQIDEPARLFRAQYRADFGEPYSLLVKIDAQTALVYSPGPGLIESARSLLPSEPRLILIAPSMGHTMGLRPWSEAFPESRVAATSGARSRLLNKTGLPVVFDTREINEELPDWISVLDLDDNPFGECWLKIMSQEEYDTVYWAVCDSLMNLDSLGTNPLLRTLLKWYGLAEGLHVHQRFRRGIKDRPGFGRWADAQFDLANRQVLVPCHGEIADDDNLREQLAALIKRNFPG